MPTSSYEGFDVYVENADGSRTPLASQTVKVYDVTNNANLSNLTTDGVGHITGGTLSVDAGTVVRFRVENYLGLSGAIEQTTT